MRFVQYFVIPVSHTISNDSLKNVINSSNYLHEYCGCVMSHNFSVNCRFGFLFSREKTKMIMM